jgi:hypothetical protein
MLGQSLCLEKWLEGFLRRLLIASPLGSAEFLNTPTSSVTWYVEGRRWRRDGVLAPMVRGPPFSTKRVKHAQRSSRVCRVGAPTRPGGGRTKDRMERGAGQEGAEREAEPELEPNAHDERDNPSDFCAEPYDLINRCGEIGISQQDYEHGRVRRAPIRAL